MFIELEFRQESDSGVGRLVHATVVESVSLEKNTVLSFLDGPFLVHAHIYTHSCPIISSQP